MPDTGIFVVFAGSSGKRFHRGEPMFMIDLKMREQTGVFGNRTWPQT
jgi:hypothetical protein